MEIDSRDLDARALLRSCTAFAELAPDVLERLLPCLRERDFEAGEVLIRQGDPGDFLLLLAEGSASAYVRNENGDSHMLGRFVRGDIAGEMALLTREPRTADVVADTGGHAYELPAESFRELISQHLELGSVLTNLIADRLGAGSHDALGGKLLSGYRVGECIGRGGMAIVYRAEDVESQRTVALKMMSHRLLHSTQARQRFRQEAEVLGSLEHPNIARLLGGFPAFSTYFLAMEYCDGPTLEEVIATTGPFPEEAVRAIVGQLARALDYLHDRGIMHRDLKPANVMMTSDGTVKLTDFGLARPQTVSADAATTQMGALTGTPLYMAPEQLSGELGDASSDLYALACVVYEMAAGKRLFQGETLLDIVRSKVTTVLPPREQIGHGVSEELYLLMLRGLQELPADRTVDLKQLGAWSAPVNPNRIQGAAGG